MSDNRVWICAFQYCSNSTYTLSRWSRLTCLKHRCKRIDDACQCPPTFTVHAFPTENRDLAAWLKWVKAVYWKRTNGKNWLPSTDDRICSIHFIDEKPTAAHLYPTQNLGVNVSPTFSRKAPKLRQESAQHNIYPSKPVGDVCPMTGNDQQPQHNDATTVMSTCNCSPARHCVCWKTYRMNMMNLRKLSLSPRCRFWPTRNKTTLLDFWPAIRNSEHILGSLIDQLLTVSSISLHARHI